MANTTAQSKGNSGPYSGYFSIVAWAIVILLFILIAKTKVGYTFLMYFCLASIVIVLAIGSPTIVSIFSQGAIVQPQGASNS